MQRELVERAIGGDQDAFSDLVRASLSRQDAIATLILRDGDRAQDAVQKSLQVRLALASAGAAWERPAL